MHCVWPCSSCRDVGKGISSLRPCLYLYSAHQIRRSATTKRQIKLFHRSCLHCDGALSQLVAARNAFPGHFNSSVRVLSGRFTRFYRDNLSENRATRHFSHVGGQEHTHAHSCTHVHAQTHTRVLIHMQGLITQPSMVKSTSRPFQLSPSSKI